MSNNDKETTCKGCNWKIEKPLDVKRLGNRRESMCTAKGPTFYAQVLPTGQVVEITGYPSIQDNSPRCIHFSSGPVVLTS